MPPQRLNMQSSTVLHNLVHRLDQFLSTQTLLVLCYIGKHEPSLETSASLKDRMILDEPGAAGSLQGFPNNETDCASSRAIRSCQQHTSWMWPQPSFRPFNFHFVDCNDGY